MIVKIAGESLTQVIIPQSGKQFCMIYGTVDSEKLDLRIIAESVSAESLVSEKNNGGMASNLMI